MESAWRRQHWVESLFPGVIGLSQHSFLNWICYVYKLLSLLWLLEQRKIRGRGKPFLCFCACGDSPGPHFLPRLVSLVRTGHSLLRSCLFWKCISLSYPILQKQTKADMGMLSDFYSHWQWQHNLSAVNLHRCDSDFVFHGILKL